MDLSKNSKEKVFTVKRKIYKEYSYFGSSSSIPTRTKQYWAAKKKNRCENNDHCDVSISTVSLNRSSNESSNGSVIQDIEDNDECTTNTPNCFTSLNNDEEAASSNEISVQQNNNLVEEQNLSVNQYTFFLPSTRPNCNTIIVDNSSYSTDDLIAALTFLSVKLRHKLTYSATEDFVRGMSILNDLLVVKASKYHWKNIVNVFSDPVTIHHLCPECELYLGEQKKKIADDINREAEVLIEDFHDPIEDEYDTIHCDSCDKDIDRKLNISSGHSFLYFSLKYQLEQLFENSNVHCQLQQHREKMKKHAFEDIQDGKEYKKRIESDMISITFNTDGVPVFDSSNCSAYPILCSINELQPLKRKKHVLLAGLWVGTGSPNSLQEFFKPFVSEAEDLYQKGFEYIVGGKKFVRKCSALLSVNDALVRPKLRNSMQFNEEYGCGLCLNPGKRIEKGLGNVRIYPIESSNAYGEVLRTNTATIKHAESKEKVTVLTGKLTSGLLFYYFIYVDHWALLVDGISLLLQTSIMPSDIYYAYNCLIDFIIGVKDLYGEQELTFNVHSLAHLA
ncbi:Protein of unknown function [Cotesia congregata]|uniref:Uncharacterized protein n=1 Tax=Cotesia congregata TaxID=51543 RepID=A0A8J2HEN3_COTCN|nr:Protein of unknown function [Cotesia congregata]